MDILTPIQFKEFFENHLSDEDFNRSLNKAISFGCKGCRGQKRGRFDVHQCGREVSLLMQMLDPYKIESYLEVGVERAGMWLIMDSFFRASNPSYKGSVGLDLKVVRPILERLAPYKEAYETIDFVQGDCFDYVPEEKFDYIFIDNNLKYDKMKKCFEQFLPHAKRFIGFHDIQDGRYGAKILWKELKLDYDTVEFIHSGAGIGIIKL